MTLFLTRAAIQIQMKFIFATDLGVEPFDKLVELEEANISSNYHFSKFGS